MKKNKTILCSFLCITAVMSCLVPTSNAANGTRKVPIYSVSVPDNKIALTFNCAWNDDDIPRILEILKEADIKCTFYIVGDFARRCPESVLEIYNAGHELANHSDTHPDMTKLSQEEIEAEINACNDEIVKLTGFTPNLFRAPSGAYDNKTIEAAEKLSMLTIQWNTDSLDWKGLSAEEITARVLSKTKNGSIILMHSGTPNTANSLEKLICGLKEKFTLVTTGELIYKQNYQINPSNGLQSKTK